MACVDDDVSTRRSMVLYKNENENCDADSDDGSMKVCIDEPRALVVHPHKVSRGFYFVLDHLLMQLRHRAK